MAKDPTRDRAEQRSAYLPPRAAKARKLILRSQLGLPWLLAAALFGLVILVAGVLFLVKGGRPGAPWERVGPVASFADGAVTQAPYRAGEALVVDRRGGTLRAFLVAHGSCPVVGASDGFARPCTGQVWDSEGRPAPAPRATSLPPPLRAVPVTVARGDLYLNPPPTRPRGRQGGG